MPSFLIKKYLGFSLCLISVYCFGQDHRPKSPQKQENKEKIHPVDSSQFVEIVANPQLKGSFFKNLFIGHNYRKEWTEKIRVPVLHLGNEYGGLRPKKQGGGKETRSLQVKDKEGSVWALRSVEKFPENAIPPEFRKTLVESIVKDDISASYPFGVLSMGVLSQASHVPYLPNRLVFLPDDPILGKYRAKFKNTLVFMEQRDPAGTEIDSSEMDENEKTINSEKLVRDLNQSHDNKVDARAVLQARLLDNFVMDFDRHEGQWIWLQRDSAEGKAFYPVPKDRDQVFYINQGILPKFARGKELFPELQGFRSKAKNIRNFNRAGRNYDRYFLAELTEKDWSKQIDDFLISMTDSVIERALHQQPPEIHKYGAEKIISTLKEKRKYFKDDMMKYYRFLSRTVAVIGSNQREQFSVEKTKGGFTLVTVNKLDDNGKKGDLIYKRLFDPHITREIQLYGLEGDDKFIVTGTKSSIKVRMIGGPGNDQFINQSIGGRLIAYDVSFENNSIEGKGIKSKISADPQNNTYARLGYYYSFIAPGLSAEYSSDGGVFIGPKLKIITKGFRKTPYGSRHIFTVNRSLTSTSYHFKYAGEFTEIFNKTDLLMGADFRTPSNKTNFFGFGNNTVFDRQGPKKLEYYHTRYDLANAYFLLRDSISTWLEIRYGGVFQYFKLRGDINADKYIATLPALNDPKTAYLGKYYAGPEVRFAVDTRNNKLMPSRGLFVNGYSRTLFGLNKNTPTPTVTQVGADFSFYGGIFPKKQLVFASRVGASANFGAFEFEQAQFLGFKQNLRGYRIQRFAGHSRAYNNMELRLKIANLNAYFFPASFGILAFNDVGRVWSEGEKSSLWHDGYGAGIWLAPVDRLVVTASLTYSKEERNLALFTFGYQF
ncbi:MAG: hypothetical protein NVSMB67_16500 [Flavisolibacter sp.]